MLLGTGKPREFLRLVWLPNMLWTYFTFGLWYLNGCVSLRARSWSDSNVYLCNKVLENLKLVVLTY